MTEKISILTPLHDDDISLYKVAVESLAKSCTDFSKAELVVKVDSLESKNMVELLLKNYDFSFTIVYNKIRGYQHFGAYFDEMVARSSGCLFLSFCADCEIYGDWVKKFLSTRGKYKNNIYVINTRPGSWALQPAFTIEWHRASERILPKGCCSLDSWLRDLAVKVERYITIPNSEVKIVTKRGDYPNKSRKIKEHQARCRKIRVAKFNKWVKRLRRTIKG